MKMAGASLATSLCRPSGLLLVCSFLSGGILASSWEAHGARSADPSGLWDDEDNEDSEEKYTDTPRDYQQDSLRSFSGGARGTMNWFQDLLAKIHVTPAQFLIGLGILGIICTWNKNKRKVYWASLAAVSWLVTAFGGAAMFFAWEAFN